MTTKGAKKTCLKNFDDKFQFKPAMVAEWSKRHAAYNAILTRPRRTKV